MLLWQTGLADSYDNFFAAKKTASHHTYTYVFYIHHIKKGVIRKQVGPTGIRTQVARIRTLSDNQLHYGTRMLPLYRAENAILQSTDDSASVTVTATETRRWNNEIRKQRSEIGYLDFWSIF
jgi:hypothetical protein